MGIVSYIAAHKIKSIFAILALIVIYAGVMSWYFPPTIPFDFSKAGVLRPDNLIHRTPSEISSHNSAFRDILVQEMAIENSNAHAHESTKMQTRGFYLAILAGLLVFLIGKSHSRPMSSGDRNLRFTEKVEKQNVLLILMTMIMVVFLYEVYQDDLYKRYNVMYHLYSRAVNELCNSPKVCGTWQVFDDTERLTQMNTASLYYVKWPRVIFSAIRPAADQIVLYILPLIALFVEVLSDKRKLSRTFARRAP